MADTSKKKKSWTVYLHVIIIFAFMFGFQFVPPIGTITPLGMQTLGILIAIVYGWSTMDMIWPSFLGLFALSLLPDTGAIATFKAGLGDRVTVAIFLFLLLAELINKVGLSKFIADWCISRKFVQGRPYAMMIMFVIAGVIISAFVNPFAGMILMVSVWYIFCKEVDLRPGEALPAVMTIALIYICNMAGNMLPFMGTAILVSGLQQSYIGTSVNYILFAFMQLILVTLAATFYFLFLKFVVRPDVSKLKNYKIAGSSSLKMTSQQKLVFSLVVALMILLFLPGLLPAELALTKVLKAIDIAGPVAMVLVIYYIVMLRSNNAVPFSEITKDLNWSLIFMFATVTPLAAAVSNPDSGIMTYLSTLLNGIVGGMSSGLVVIMLLFIASNLTQFCNNIAIILMITPLLFSFAPQIGIDPSILTILIVFNLNTAYCTPAASGPAAMIFSNKTWVPTKDAYKHGLVIFVINMVVTVIGLFLCEIFF